jgi:GH18 family chitinase
VKDIDPFICTHLIYGFVGINEDATVRVMDPWLELPDNWGKGKKYYNFILMNTIFVPIYIGESRVAPDGG